jgi:uncharacterized protein YjbI with pentapeptide repeats
MFMWKHFLTIAALSNLSIYLTARSALGEEYFLTQNIKRNLPACYMEIENGTVFDLTELCRGNTKKNNINSSIEKLLKTKSCSRCNLKNANLADANLTGSDLSYANLANANLSGANLIGANLTGADTTNTIFKGTVMPDGTIRN